jgi:hypothetical protein
MENNSAQTSPDSVSELEALRLPDAFRRPGAGIKLPPKPSFGKLSKYRFSRVHPGQEYRFRALLVKDKEDGMGAETYIAHPNFFGQLGRLASVRILRLAVDTSGALKLIAEPPPDDKKSNSWNDSLRHAIEVAQEKWVRIEPNMDQSQYELIIALHDLGAPLWPAQSMRDIVDDCFKGRLILDDKHPLLQQLEGRA